VRPKVFFSFLLSFISSVLHHILGLAFAYQEPSFVVMDLPNGDRLGESSETIRARVQVARDTQQVRFSNIEFLQDIL
jgi:predicted ATPase with chaperone activity